MYSRWYNVAVVALWLASMGWLLTQKVLPPLLVGQPPSYRTIVDAQQDEALVGWALTFNNRRLGWALSTTSKFSGELTEVRSRVHFEHIPLEELTPAGLRDLLRLIELPSNKLHMDARSAVRIDSAGRLLSFDSSVQLDPLEKRIELHGRIEGTRMDLSFRSGEFAHQTSVYLPPNGLLCDALSPQSQLPGLHAGQTWTAPSYNPLRPNNLIQNNPMEILQATVEGIEPTVWDGRMEETWLVVYRSDPGYSLGSGRTPRGRLWVRGDGTVLKQQIMVFESSMTFERLTDREAARLKDQIGDGW